MYSSGQITFVILVSAIGGPLVLLVAAALGSPTIAFRDLDGTRSLELVRVESVLFRTCSRRNNFYVYRSINVSVTGHLTRYMYVCVSFSFVRFSNFFVLF